MEAQMTVNATRNGLDMDLLQGIVGELREHPETATVTVRTRHAGMKDLQWKGTQRGSNRPVRRVPEPSPSARTGRRKLAAETAVRRPARRSLARLEAVSP
jgi:hypothetical protein